MRVVSEIHADLLTEIGAGEGRNSHVYLAYDPQLDGNIAIKQIGVNELNVDDYFREARIVYKSKCSRIVPIMYASRDAEYVRLAMPYFPNGSLKSILSVEHPTIRQTLIWADHISTALRHVHSRGFVHLDVKPSNILIGDDGAAMLADFGQSRPLDSLGTAEIPPLYCYHFPPEALQFIGRISAAADQYQLGLTLYRLCNGDASYYAQVSRHGDALRNAIASGSFPDRRTFLPHVPRRLRRIIRKLLAVNPEDRYGEILEVQDALNQVEISRDWRYYEKENACLWRSENSTHKHGIELLQRAPREWCVEGYVVRKSDGRKSRKGEWSSSGFITKKLAFAYLEKLFNEMEAR